MLARLRDWYHAPAGLREVLAVTLPLVVSTSSWTILQFTDRLFLLWLSPDAVAASLPAGTLSFAIACFPFGLVTYATTFVAQYYGAGRLQRIAPVVWQAVFLALAFTPLLLISNLFAYEMFSANTSDPRIVEMEVVYFKIMNYGAGAVLLSQALQSFFVGRGLTRVVMFVDMGAAVANIILDYAWIFGEWGFPAWGVAGAAWATTVSLWGKAAVYFYLFVRVKGQEEFNVLGIFGVDVALMWRMIRYGWVNGLQLAIEVIGFAMFIMLVGRLGALELAATALAFNVNMLAFLPVYGTGMAASTLVGQRLGDNQPDLAARSAWTAFAVATLYMFCFAAIYVLLPDVLLWFHSRVPSDATLSTVPFEDLRQTTIVLLRFVAFYCLFDSMYAVMGGAIKGAGDIRFVLVTSTVLSLTVVGVTWSGLNYWGFGLIECWITLTAWVCLLGLAYLARFMSGRWRDMRVIEPELADESEEVLAAASDSTLGYRSSSA